jgi:hypothetical protein
MSHKGVGARIAWSIESKRVLKDLVNLLGRHPVELVEFAEGEALRQATLESYAKARTQGDLKVNGFADSASFSEAIRREIQRWNPSERLTVFLQDSERKGVYAVAQAALTEGGFELLSYDGNCVFLVSAGNAHGLLLDIEQAAGGAAVFQLESW